MTTTPPEAPAEPGPERSSSGPRTSREEVRDLGRLRRSTSDSKLAGVAGGLARHLDVDPVIIRVAFVVLVFFGGSGLILYGAGWLLVPADDGTEAPLRLDDRNRTVALTVIGVLALLSMLGDSWGVFSFPWPLAILALVTLLLLDRSERKRRGHSATQPTTDASTWEGPVAPPPAPRDPRRRGPVLFWPTMALCALGIGVLGLIETGGVPVADAAYPALVVATCGAVLVLGAFWGRAGGLVAVGVVAALAMGAATLTSEMDAEEVTHRPTTAAELASSYQVTTGELVVDLTGVTDLEALDGRTLLLEAGVGTVEVLVPAGLDVETEASVGIGNARLLGQDEGGFGVEITSAVDGGDNAPAIRVDAHVGVGQVEVRATGERGDR